MASGAKTEIFNTRERAVSTDHNRLQSFIAFDRAEELRRLSNCRQTVATTLENAQGGGILETGSYVDTAAQDTAAIGSPLRGDVYEGLVVLPQPTTLNLLVSPGIVGLDDPDGQAGSSQAAPPDPDDSRYKVVDDPGVQTVGVLVLAAGGGGTRIDVIECQRMQVVTETDSRDVFDPSTGVFVPTVVNKVIEGQLVYRIRSGTPGAGFPGTVQGWLPLCVVSVPSSASSVDDCTFWDVRPLVKDRVSAPLDSQHASSFLQGDCRAFANQTADPTKTNTILCVTSQIGMYRAGGLGPLIDLQDVANHEAGYSAVNKAIWYLYAVFPSGLPRWVQYTEFPLARFPNGSLGIRTLSSTGPTQQFDTPIAASITPPAATGLGATPGPAAVLLAGLVGPSTTISGCTMEGGHTIFDVAAQYTVPSADAQPTSDRYVLLAGFHYPKPARRVLLTFTCAFSGGTPATALPLSAVVSVVAPGSNTPLFSAPSSFLITSIVSPSGTGDVKVTVEVPTLFFSQGTGFVDDNLEVMIDWGNDLARTNALVAVAGWKM